MLIAHNAAVDARTKYGDTPLHYAAACDQPDSIETLVAAGAVIDAKNNVGGHPPPRGGGRPRSPHAHTLRHAHARAHHHHHPLCPSGNVCVCVCVCPDALPRSSVPLSFSPAVAQRLWSWWGLGLVSRRHCSRPAAEGVGAVQGCSGGPCRSQWDSIFGGVVSGAQYCPCPD